MKIQISSHADYSRSDFIFPRARTDADHTQWERSDRLRSKIEIATTWGIIIASGCAGLRIVLFIYEIAIAQGVLL